MSKAGQGDVLKKWQTATEWKEITRGVVKQATKFAELMSALTAEGDTLTEELLKVHKLLSGPDVDGLPDGDILECSVMVLRNNIKCFVIMQREMMAKLLESFDTPLANAVDMDLLDSHETKKMYVKAQTEYDENKAKIQENIRKKKMDPEVILSCEKELDRLSLATEELRNTLDSNLDNLNSKRTIVYSKCMLQLMDKHHEFFLNGWDVLADIRPRLAALEDHLSHADDKAPTLIKEAGRRGYLMKKTGFGWTKCWVSVQAQQKKPVGTRASNLVNDTTIVLTWQPTTAKPSKDGRRKVDVCLCTVRLRPSAGEFEVVTPSKKRPLVLQAESDSERSAWIDALLLAISLGLQGINKNPPQMPVLQESHEGDKDAAHTNGVATTLLNISVLARVEGNNVCADCDAPDPDWASINLGVLLCLECSGVHRNMGTHISKVRSLNLDVWDQETIMLAQRLGNRRVNGFYESNSVKVAANKPSKNSERETRMRFVQGKYKDLRFVEDERKGSASGMLGVMLCESAARNSDVLDVLMLLVLGADPNMLGPGPEQVATTLVTPMISAICHNNPVLLELILQNGGDLFVPDANGLSALQQAVSQKQPQCVSLLLRRGYASKTATPLRFKALELAEAQNDEQLIKLLKIETAAPSSEQMPGSPGGSSYIAKSKSPLSRTLSISTGAVTREDDDEAGTDSSPPNSRRNAHQPHITVSPAIPIRHGRPAARTIASLPSSPLSASAPTSPILSTFANTLSKSNSPTRPALALSVSYESPGTSPRTDTEAEADARQYATSEDPEPPEKEKEERTRSRRLSLKRHSKKLSVDEKTTREMARENSKERALSRENSRENNLTLSRERSNSLKEREKEKAKEEKREKEKEKEERKEREKEEKREKEKEKEKEKEEKREEKREREKEKEKEKEERKEEKKGRLRSNSNGDKGRERSNSTSKEGAKDHRETLRENSKENLREYIKGKLGKKDKKKDKDKDKDRGEKDKELDDSDRDKEPEIEFNPFNHPHPNNNNNNINNNNNNNNNYDHRAPSPTSSSPPSSPIPSTTTSPQPSAPTSPQIPHSTHATLHASTPNASTLSSSSTTPTTLSSSAPASPSASSAPFSSAFYTSLAPSSNSNANDAPEESAMQTSFSGSYAYSPLPSAAPHHGYSPLPSHPGGGYTDGLATDDYPDPTPIPPDPASLNQFDNPDMKSFFALSTQIMELVNTLKNLVKGDETTKKISSGVSSALKEIESFSNKERLPHPQHVIHDKDHLQQKLNRLLGIVSTMGRVYQLQHHVNTLSSSADEALARYCGVLGKVCKMLEEGLE